MKSLIVKDKKLRKIFKKFEKRFFVLKFIKNNSNYSNLIRWNAFETFKKLNNKHKAKIKIISKCRETINKKRFNQQTYYCRHMYLRIIRFGLIHGIQKANW
jgi:hypothetical protein